MNGTDMGTTVGKSLAAVIGGLLIIFLMAFIYGFIVMLLWNWLIPVFIPTLPIAQTITYWQGFGLAFLIKMLFNTSKG